MPPIRFAFGLHLHQPVGNFDHVFAQHVDDVYRPLLDALADREFLPVVLHLSGPLLEWLEAHDAAYLDRLGRLAADGRVELLLAGFYEPVLASLPRRDRVEQIRWMHEAVRRRFGVDARGLWLTERVWEPELAADLADAGVRYALVDDRHFLVTGFAAEQLHAPFWTESDGKRVALFPIDERLRYLIPFRPPEETADYLRELRAAGHRLAVLADDGEKFGGWPGTKEWVYGQGWLDRFMADDRGAGGQRRGGAEPARRRARRGARAVDSPTCRRRPTGRWRPGPCRPRRAPPAPAGARPGRGAGGRPRRRAHSRRALAQLSGQVLRVEPDAQEDDGAERAGPRRGDPPAVRRAIGRAQCNDAYWHGVFGGLYLPHLRDAIWRNLAEAEAGLRRGKGLRVGACSTSTATATRRSGSTRPPSPPCVSPARGGAIEEYTAVRVGHQLRQHAHPPARGIPRPRARAGRRGCGGGGRSAASIHDIEEGSGSTCARRSTSTTARSSSTGCCRDGATLEDYAAAARGPVSRGPGGAAGARWSAGGAEWRWRARSRTVGREDGASGSDSTRTARSA